MSSDSYGTPHPNSVGPPDSDPKEIRQRNYVYAEIDRYRIREMYCCTAGSPVQQGKLVLTLYFLNTWYQTNLIANCGAYFVLACLPYEILDQTRVATDKLLVV